MGKTNSNSMPIILIVDDKATNLQVLGTVLMEQNYNVIGANNGKNALKILKQTTPDLILLDVMMPVMNGYDACIQIKKNDKYKDIPIIFLTAKTELEDIVKGFELGGVDYITKPFNHTELLARIYTHVELKKSRDKIKKAEKELRNLNSEKDKFFSIIAHDLKSPFNVLLNFSDILANDFDDIDVKEQKEIIGYIQKSAKNTYNLLENLLMWSRLQRGKIALNTEKINLFELSFETIKLLSYLAEKKSIKIINKIPDDAFIIADKNMLSTILRNLISNAIKFTPKGGTIEIGCKNTIEKRDALSQQYHSRSQQIYVKDNGVGIKLEMQEKIFKISENVSTKGTESEAGTGLGLILCKDFVEKHGGKIWVESKNKGSVFNFTIPKLRTPDT